MSAIAHLYGYIMTKLWITEYSGFKKDFVSFTMKNIHALDVSSIENSICEFLLVKFSITQKELRQTDLLNLSLNAPWKLQSTWSVWFSAESR